MNTSRRSGSRSAELCTSPVTDAFAWVRKEPKRETKLRSFLEGETNDQHEFISDAYCEDLMQGEALADSKIARQIRDIIIV